MKHIKPFNENVDSFELKDFCENNLAYLLDDGVQVDITNTGPFNGIALFECRITSNYKEWSSIKDHMIPFLTRLQNKYNIIPYPDGHDILVRGKRQMDTNGFLTIPHVTGRGYVRELIEDSEEIVFHHYSAGLLVRKDRAFFLLPDFYILDFTLYIQQK